MKLMLRKIASLALCASLGGCGGGMLAFGPPFTSTYDFGDLKVTLTTQAELGTCMLTGAELNNVGRVDRGGFLVRLLVTDSSGRTIAQRNIMFPATAAGGSASASSVGEPGLADGTCDGLTAHVSRY